MTKAPALWLGRPAVSLHGAAPRTPHVCRSPNVDCRHRLLTHTHACANTLTLKLFFCGLLAPKCIHTWQKIMNRRNLAPRIKSKKNKVNVWLNKVYGPLLFERYSASLWEHKGHAVLESTCLHMFVRSWAWLTSCSLPPCLSKCYFVFSMYLQGTRGVSKVLENN